MKFKRYLYINTAIFLWPLLLESGAVQAKQPAICIIGAGASGITAAAELAQMGYGKGPKKIKLFEAKQTVGGKCDSEAKDGDVFEMGAVLAAPTYKWARYFADMVGHPFVPHARIDALTACDGGHKIQAIDEYYNIPALSNPFDLGENCEVFSAIKRYDDLAEKLMGDDGVIDYDTLSEEFYDLDKHGQKQLKSFIKFAEEQDLGIVVPWFELFVNSFGYLSLDEIPALYVMDYISNLAGYWAYLKGFATSRRLHSGYEVLLKEILNHFRSNIDLTLGARVKKIDRSTQTLTYEKEGQDYEESCDHFIIAVEPGNIIDMLDNPSVLEQRMKESLVYSPYRTLVVKSNIPRGAYTLPNESKSYSPGDVVLIANDFQEEEGDMRRTLLYTIEDNNTIKRSSHEVLLGIRHQMEKYGFRVDEIVKDSQGQELHRAWPNYFPHFNTYILDQIDRAQGLRNTYYVGPAYNGFELVERSMAHGAKIAHSYFANAQHPVPSEDRFKSHKSFLGIPDWSDESDKVYP